MSTSPSCASSIAPSAWTSHETTQTERTPQTLVELLYMLRFTARTPCEIWTYITSSSRGRLGHSSYNLLHREGRRPNR